MRLLIILILCWVVSVCDGQNLDTINLGNGGRNVLTDFRFPALAAFAEDSYITRKYSELTSELALSTDAISSIQEMKTEIGKLLSKKIHSKEIDDRDPTLKKNIFSFCFDIVEQNYKLDSYNERLGLLAYSADFETNKTNYRNLLATILNNKMALDDFNNYAINTLRGYSDFSYLFPLNSPPTFQKSCSFMTDLDFKSIEVSIRNMLNDKNFREPFYVLSSPDQNSFCIHNIPEFFDDEKDAGLIRTKFHLFRGIFIIISKAGTEPFFFDHTKASGLKIKNEELPEKFSKVRFEKNTFGSIKFLVYEYRGKMPLPPPHSTNTENLLKMTDLSNPCTVLSSYLKIK